MSRCPSPAGVQRQEEEEQKQAGRRGRRSTAATEEDADPQQTEEVRDAALLLCLRECAEECPALRVNTTIKDASNFSVSLAEECEAPPRADPGKAGGSVLVGSWEAAAAHWDIYVHEPAVHVCLYELLMSDVV